MTLREERFRRERNTAREKASLLAKEARELRVDNHRLDKECDALVLAIEKLRETRGPTA